MYKHDSDAASLAESYTELSEILMPDDTNNLGRALGGSILHWMDICAAIASRRFARRQVVTAAMDHVDFRGPIELGDVVVVTGYVFDTGSSSMDVKVEVRSERPEQGEYEQTATSFFTMVALDDAGDPTTVPSLHCETETEQALREAAVERREKRRAALVA
ncbi:acyl-CoA thioesterase [Haloarchaeobius amylolyticus]|uniref:acyl-CoA thioesterase n=1 Tax=Haloarchaeobius amylolyticus TaxID=1198296 RepID=UPI00227157A7|nr:acyl-CoA thioesterase [Haloarchaeobius amylolyticus]